MGWAVRVLAALVLAGTVMPSMAEEFYGPLRVRDMGPFQLLRLNMLPDHAIAPTPRQFALELHWSASNTFAMDHDVAQYLAARGGRGEISRQDAENISALSDNAFLFDGSLGYFNMTAHLGISDRWSGYFSVPAHHYSGGFMDRTIEDFHETFGFDSFGREYVDRDEFQALVVVDGNVFYLPEAPTRNGLGDPVIGLRYYHPLGGHSAVTFELAHKLSVLDPDDFLSTGSSDTGVQVSWHTHGLRNSIYTSLALVRAGRADPFPEHTRRYAPSINIAWENRLAENLNLVLQLNAARSVFEDGADEELTANVYQASIGLRQRHGEFVWSYALTENLVNFNNTADLGVHIGFAWLPQP
ncbi:MAG: DUF3187 family protein [Proteobacteria bacterium]|nr:DUF3187 family protein [Pseudomonadota bacterium]